jgi:hypothetical protein
VRTPPKKQNGKGTGPRRFDGELLDVAAAAALLGESDKTTRSQIARGLLPYRRLSGRIVLVRSELQAFIRSLPGVSLSEALENIERRRMQQ